TSGDSPATGWWRRVGIAMSERPERAGGPKGAGRTTPRAVPVAQVATGTCFFVGSNRLCGGSSGGPVKDMRVQNRAIPKTVSPGALPLRLGSSGSIGHLRVLVLLR